MDGLLSGHVIVLIFMFVFYSQLTTEVINSWQNVEKGEKLQQTKYSIVILPST